MSFLSGLFGKFSHFITEFRKKKDTIDILEDLEKEIKVYEKYKQTSEGNEKKYVGALLLYSIVLYIMGAIFYFIYLMPKNLGDRVKTLIPFFIVPLLIFSIRKFLKWFYIKRLANYENKLIDLKEEKKNILEEVKEKETYKKARAILERFSSGVDLQITPPTSPQNNQSILLDTTSYNNPRNNQLNETSMTGPRMNSNNPNQSTLIHRNVKQIQQQNMSISQAPRPQNLDMTKSQANLLQNSETPSNASNVSHLGAGGNNMAPSSVSRQRTLLPRPIIAPNRTIFDKVLDFLIGEGPNNRYALVCKSCHFHNGMALREEFEFLAFRCAYCLFYNESRKRKLIVPQTQLNSIADSNMNESSASTSNLSSAASFEGEGMHSEEPQSQVSEPVISISVLQKQYKSSLNSQNGSQKSIDNINLLNDEDSGRRKGSLGDLSNHLTKRLVETRRSSYVETLISSSDIDKENEDDDMDFEHVEDSKKYE